MDLDQNSMSAMADEGAHWSEREERRQTEDRRWERETGEGRSRPRLKGDEGSVEREAEGAGKQPRAREGRELDGATGIAEPALISLQTCYVQFSTWLRYELHQT